MKAGQCLWAERNLVIVYNESLQHVRDELDQSIHRRLVIPPRKLNLTIGEPGKLVDGNRCSLLFLGELFGLTETVQGIVSRWPYKK